MSQIDPLYELRAQSDAIENGKVKGNDITLEILSRAAAYSGIEAWEDPYNRARDQNKSDRDQMYADADVTIEIVIADQSVDTLDEEEVKKRARSIIDKYLEEKKR